MAADWAPLAQYVAQGDCHGPPSINQISLTHLGATLPVPRVHAHGGASRGIGADAGAGVVVVALVVVLT